MRLALLVLATTFTLMNPASSAAQSSWQKPNATPPSQQPGPDPFAGAPAARPDDVRTLESILAALYDVISGPAGERDWNRFRSLFVPTARLTSTGKAPDGTVVVHPNSVEDYVNRAGAFFRKTGFFESAIVNRILAFGNVAQVFSSYESRHAPGEAPFSRGINSIQLLNDGKRWWVVSILWDSERPDNPLPKDFASKQ